MNIAMPRVLQMPTPNYTPSLIAHDLVILHMMEGGYAGSVAWLCDRRAQASAHLCMNDDGSEVTQLVPLQYKAWAQKAFNGKGVSVEMPGFTAKGVPDHRLRALAKIAAWLCRFYAIPPLWAKGGQGRGVCTHHDLGPAGGGPCRHLRRRRCDLVEGVGLREAGLRRFRRRAAAGLCPSWTASAASDRASAGGRRFAVAWRGRARRWRCLQSPDVVGVSPRRHRGLAMAAWPSGRQPAACRRQ